MFTEVNNKKNLPSTGVVSRQHCLTYITEWKKLERLKGESILFHLFLFGIKPAKAFIFEGQTAHQPLAAIFLTRNELRYILDPKDVYGPDFSGETFRVLKEKEEECQYGEYRTRRLVLEAWDNYGVQA
jgi:hypothetical protein